MPVADRAERGGGVALLTIEQAARALNVPFTWLRDKVTTRQVPHTRLGRHVRFTPAHVQQIIAGGEQPGAATARCTQARRARPSRLS